MKITAISDLHGDYPELSGGDLLIIAGDCTSNDSVKAWVDFFKWFDLLEYRSKIYIGGNHDNFLSQCCNNNECADIIYGPECEKQEYLRDSGTEFHGIKIWGSPWSLWFHGINPHCKAFTGKEKDLKKYWDIIPLDTEILITHTPPFGMLDTIYEWGDPDKKKYAGSKTLADKLLQLKNLKLHVFGHIHEEYGHCYAAYAEDHTPLGHLSINASHMNREYEAVNQPINIEYDKEKGKCTIL
jgi:Icc-related predicted phosphoesterase